MADLNSWEEDQDAQDESLSRQAAQQLHMGNPAHAQSFRPGANSFQPGAQTFQPGQQYYNQQPQYNQYQQQGYGGYPQYQQQQYPQYGQQQQFNQGYNQYGGYQQQNFAPQQQNSQQYQQQPRQQQQQFGAQPPAAPKIAKRGEDVPQATGSAIPASNGTQAPKAKVLSIGATGTAPAAVKTLSIGGDGSAKVETAGKTKVLSIGATSAEKPADKVAPKEAEKRTDGSVPDAGSKVTAAKAIEKTGEAKAATAKASGTTSPTPSSGRDSPTTEKEKKANKEADAVAKEQEAEVDEEALKDMYGKEHVNVIFLGHVDAGKSTLGGSILVQTGMVDERTLDKYKREAKEAGREFWFLSWVLDLNKEERAKGKTVEVGRGFFETEKRKYSILDAPGHKTFVPNMIGGASQADVGVLVISARKGEYETGFEKGGQTREHAILAKTQGVNKLVVCVNKMDDPTVEWSEERYKQCISKLTVFLKGLGYNPATDLTFMPVSALTYKGIKTRVPKDECSWYDGPSLLEYLDGMQALERKLTAPFMMPIAAKYRDLGTVIEGKIEAGIVKKENNYLLMPNRDTISISALYGETEDEIKTAAAGEQVRMRIRGVEEEDIMPGFVLCTPSRPVHCVTAFEAQIRLLELKSILSAGFNCVLHVHAAQEEVTFAALLHKLEPKTNRKSKKPPGFAKQGMNIIARLEVTGGAGSVCVERFEDYPQLGRFTLRDQGQTIAIGKITKLIID